MIISPVLVSIMSTTLVWFYIHYSFNRNFSRVYHWPKQIVFIVDFLILFCTSFRLIQRMKSDILTSSLYQFTLNLSYIALGFLGLLSLILIILDLEQVFHILTDKYFSKKSQAPEGRRAFLKKTVTLGGLTSAIAVTGAGYATSFNPKTKNVKIPLRDQYKDLSGLKIVQLSDIHIGPTLKREFAQMLVDRTNALNPDLIVITGDLIDGDVGSIGVEIEPFRNFKAPLGVFYITGNHEYYWGAESWIEKVRSLGITALMNENRVLKFNNTEFYLCGVTDLYSAKYDPPNSPDYTKAIANTREDKYKILLAHQPKAIFEASKFNFNLQLSGHTHGGQGVPWNIIVRMVQPYISGYYVHEHMDLYVNNGAGFWGPPNRFMIDSEIAFIELKHGV
jgi:predicted MPP superfamily phosphohydrolase